MKATWGSRILETEQATNFGRAKIPRPPSRFLRDSRVVWCSMFCDVDIDGYENKDECYGNCNALESPLAW